MATEKPTKAVIMLPGNVSQTLLDSWKAKHSEVHIITVKVAKDDDAVGYYKKPDRHVLANVINMQSIGQVFESREFLAQNTWLGGDERHQTNDDVSMPAQVELAKSVNFLAAEVKKY